MKNPGNIPYPFEARVRVESYLHGIRIDRFLARHFRNYTVYRIQRMISAGLVSVDEIRVSLDCRIHQGEEVKIRLLEPPDKLLEPESIPIRVLYEDSWIIVVDKPAGQVVHPVGIYQTGTLCNAVQFHLDQQTALKGLLRPGIVHRLDRMTSGVIVITKDHISHRRLSIDFQNSKVSKTYLTLVEGEIKETKGMIDRPIGLFPGKGSILMSASTDAKFPKPAKTRYQVLETVEGKTLVEAFPKTGRNHQIRVHFASIGHPVIGDEYYGAFGKILKDPYARTQQEPKSSRVISGSVKSNVTEPRHALHASELNFKHPVTKKELKIKTCFEAEEILNQFLEISAMASN